MATQSKTAEPTIVNGINVNDLFALIDGVKREPAKGRRSCFTPPIVNSGLVNVVTRHSPTQWRAS